MASIIYDSFMNDLALGSFNIDTATVKVMLVTSGYSPNKGLHDRRNDVTNEVTGTGYTAGGLTSDVTLSLNTTSHQLDIQFANVTWPTSTITARACVLYVALGGAASADPLIAYVDFGTDVSSTAAAFSVTFSSALRFQN